jgi:hypothetical protein
LMAKSFKILQLHTFLWVILAHLNPDPDIVDQNQADPDSQYWGLC